MAIGIALTCSWNRFFPLIKHSGLPTTSRQPHAISRGVHIAERVQAVLDSSDEIYEIEFNMNRLAELVDVPVRSVSKVINEVYGKN